MKTRQLGADGPRLAVLGFGAWAIGGPWVYGWGKVDDSESIKAIHLALDRGINWIDTAAAYGLGHSEEIVAKAVHGIRKEVFIATKCGLVPDGKGDVVRCSRPESIRREAEESLRRLRLELIDLYQIHWHDREVPVEDSWGTMASLQKEGKVRYIGVSNYDVPLLEQCIRVAPVQSLQPPYGLLSRNVEKTTLRFCQTHGIGVVAYSPMQSGLLTGRFDINKLAADDWRHKSSLFQEPMLTRVMSFVDTLRPIAKKRNKTVGQIAVSWVLKNPAVTSAIVGARSAAQVEENVGAADTDLSGEEMDTIDMLLKASFGEEKG